MSGVFTTKVSIDRHLDKEDVVHIYNGMLLGHRKNEILPFVTTWVDLEGIRLSETNQRKTNMILLIYGI